MNEPNWLNSTNARAMIQFLERYVTPIARIVYVEPSSTEQVFSFDPFRTAPSRIVRPPTVRKLRLFGMGCCRRFWNHFTDAQLRQAAEIAESAPGLCTFVVQAETEVPSPAGIRGGKRSGRVAVRLVSNAITVNVRPARIILEIDPSTPRKISHGKII